MYEHQQQQKIIHRWKRKHEPKSNAKRTKHFGSTHSRISTIVERMKERKKERKKQELHQPEAAEKNRNQWEKSHGNLFLLCARFSNEHNSV